MNQFPHVAFTPENIGCAELDLNRLPGCTHALATLNTRRITQICTCNDKHIDRNDSTAKFHVGLLFELPEYGLRTHEPAPKGAHIGNVGRMRPDTAHRTHV